MTGPENPTMEWIELLESTTAEFAEILADGDLAAGVPACPDWTLADLGEHLRWTHAWATHAVTHGTPDGDSPAPGLDRDALVAGYRDAARRLVDVLAETDPAAPAWAFGPAKSAGFWRRRQVHEVTMHLFDALASQQDEDDWEIDGELAWDGVEEVETLFYPRQVRLGRTAPLRSPLRLTAHDLDRSLTLEPHAEGEPVTLQSSASQLLLMLWGRRPAQGSVGELMATVALTP
ncbi:maleylpyruvate isomerase family mycothiol-dependent enzyme [Nocardioides caeni]|uniref:Maleylpyruvate isomerase family mycothiol-dependent enzyme n=1 Tax=Nocardioides caeni TaxID=574700 RepID=A0A4S8N5E3_9ACTN|nr:maleylpyruvate isomerase family mycothiol-dependent enzyme [Nocardioides caeni]THV10811.1 maleylpyruvate isomerase family mycothiol-dependent enzyme [Nocardioides caeni]